MSDHQEPIFDVAPRESHPDRGWAGKHGIAQSLFLYAREPGGNRTELYGDAGYLIFDPDWQPVTWHEEDLERGIVFYGGSLPTEFFTYGTPHVEQAEVAGPVA